MMTTTRDARSCFWFLIGFVLMHIVIFGLMGCSRPSSSDALKRMHRVYVYNIITHDNVPVDAVIDVTYNGEGDFMEDISDSFVETAEFIIEDFNHDNIAPDLIRPYLEAWYEVSVDSIKILKRMPVGRSR